MDREEDERLIEELKSQEAEKGSKMAEIMGTHSPKKNEALGFRKKESQDEGDVKESDESQGETPKKRVKFLKLSPEDQKEFMKSKAKQMAYEKTS